MNEETLDQFIARAKREIDTFAEKWRDNMTESPDEYPNKLPPQDWDEQYLSDIYGGM